MNTSPTAGIIKYVGLDVHAETFAAGIAETNQEPHSYGSIPAHTHALDRLHKRLSGPGITVRYVYGRRYSGKSSWTSGHQNFLSSQKFAFAGQQLAFEELINAAQDPAQCRGQRHIESPL